MGRNNKIGRKNTSFIGNINNNFDDKKIYKKADFSIYNIINASAGNTNDTKNASGICNIKTILMVKKLM